MCPKPSPVLPPRRGRRPQRGAQREVRSHAPRADRRNFLSPHWAQSNTGARGRGAPPGPPASGPTWPPEGPENGSQARSPGTRAPALGRAWGAGPTGSRFQLFWVALRLPRTFLAEEAQRGRRRWARLTANPRETRPGDASAVGTGSCPCGPLRGCVGVGGPSVAPGDVQVLLPSTGDCCLQCGRSSAEGTKCRSPGWGATPCHHRVSTGGGGGAEGRPCDHGEGHRLVRLRREQVGTPAGARAAHA